MSRYALFLVPFLLLSSQAYSQSRNGSYYCVAEWAGGGYFSSRTKRWEGTGFRPNLKFVMRATFISSHTDSIPVMVAHTHPQTGLAIIFEREGQKIARRFAADGSAAGRLLIIMIAEVGALQPGDRLMIEPDDDRVVEILGRRHRDRDAGLLPIGDSGRQRDGIGLPEE